jgi:hypothetical protein
MSFTSDLLYQQYLEQINNIRNSLLGSGPTTNLNDEADRKNAEYFLKVKALSGAFVAVSQYRAKKGNEKNTKYYKDLEDYSKAIVNESSVVSSQEIDNSPTQFTPSNPLYKIEDPEYAKEFKNNTVQSEEDTIKYFKDNNGNINMPTAAAYGDVPTEPGQEVLGHNGDYSKKISNATKFVTPAGNRKLATFAKSWIKPNGQPDDKTHGTPDKPLTDKIAAMLERRRKKVPGTYKFFIEKMHGKDVKGEFHKKGPIKFGLTRADLPNRMVFPAYITKFNDSYSTSWDSYDFIGRGESVYAYKSTSRSLALEFYLISDFSGDLLLKAIEDYNALIKSPKQSNKPNKLDATSPNLNNTAFPSPQNLFDSSGNPIGFNQQILEDIEVYKEIKRLYPDWGTGTTPDPSYIRSQRTGFVGGQISGTPEMLWARKTFLAQCCYGWYRKDGKLKEQPIVRIRIGDFYDVLAIVDSLDFTEDEFNLDLNPSVVGAIPMGITVSMKCTILHEDEPSSDYYKFYHRADFDKADSSFYKPDNVKETSTHLDSSLDLNQGNSPIGLISRLSEAGRDKLGFPKDITAVQETLQSFGGSLKNLSALSDISSTISSLKKTEKIKEALLNAKRLIEIGSLLEVEKLKDTGSSKELNFGSIANQEPSNVYNKTNIPKPANTPLEKQPLFPQFKQPKTPPPNT